MNLGKFPYFIVVLLVVILLTATTVIPIVNEAQNFTIIERNNPDGVYSISTTTEDIEIYLTTGGVLRINGVDNIQITDPDNVNPFKIWMNNASFRATYNSSTQNWSLYGAVWSDATTFTNEIIRSISYSDGVATCTRISGLGTFTVETDFILYPDLNGDLCEYYLRDNNRNDIHVDSESDVYFGISASYYGLIHLDADGTKTQIGYSGSADYDSIGVRYDRVDRDDGLNWQFETGPTMYRYNDGTEEISEDITNVLTYVPIKYTSYSDDAGIIKALLYMIPLMLFMVPIMMVVSVLSNGRD